MVTQRKIAVVTGSRAEYGLLRWLIEEIRNDDRLELQLVVTGMHLSSEFGTTAREIEDDGFRIDAKVHTLLASDERIAMVKSVGLGALGFADQLERLKPDIVVLLGDRFEILAAAQAAMLLGLVIAHIHGGECSEGAFDESIRHAITKMSHLHFTAAEPYRRRVLQLGEDPDRVFCFGAPGLDALRRVPPIPRATLSSELGVNLGERVLLASFHPATSSNVDPVESTQALLTAIDRIEDVQVVLTKSNADAAGRAMSEVMVEWASTRKHAVVRTSLGHQRYLSLMRIAAAVVGNSSSGLIEAPALGVPSVNVGERQAGRLKAASVIDCDGSVEEIEAALRTALSAPLRQTLRTMQLAYPAPGDVSVRIKDKLATVSLSGLLVKRFHDLEVVR